MRDITGLLMKLLRAGFITLALSLSSASCTGENDSFADAIQREKDANIITEPPSLSITFDGNSADQGEMKTISTGAGETVILPKVNYIKEGFSFNGWATSANSGTVFFDEAIFTMTDYDIRLFAVWSQNPSYVISFHANGGSGTMLNQELTQGVTRTLPENTFAKAGYYFNGWSLTSDGDIEYADKSPILMPGSNQILYANWSPNPSYTISFQKNADDVLGVMGSMQVLQGETVTLTNNSYSKSGFTFLGWALANTGTKIYNNRGEVLMGGQDLVLYAIWEENPPVTTLVDFSSEPDGLSGSWETVSGAECPSGLSPCLRSRSTITDDDISFVIINKYVNKGNLKFKWRASTEETYDVCYFKISNIVMDEISGETGWTDNTYAITTAGVKSFEWMYIKDESYGENLDACLIDQIEFP